MKKLLFILFLLLLTFFSVYVFFYKDTILITLQCQMVPDPLDRMFCYRPYIEQQVLTKNAEVAWDNVINLIQSGNVTDCHVPAHWIGLANYQKYDGDFIQAFLSCPRGCFEGCLHSVTQAHVVHQNELVSPVALCTGIAPEQTGRDYRQCIHGYGHGIMMRERDLIAALSVCEAHSDSLVRSTCTGGAVMELTHPIIEYGLTATQEEMISVCQQYEPDLESVCVSEYGATLAIASGHRADIAKEACRKYPNDLLILMCLNSVDYEIGNHQLSLRQLGVTP